jgi:hypothetical protein
MPKYVFMFVTPDLEATDSLRHISINRPTHLHEVTANSILKTCVTFNRAQNIGGVSYPVVILYVGEFLQYDLIDNI